MIRLVGIAAAFVLIGLPAWAEAQSAGMTELKVSAQELAIIGQALSELPYKLAAPVLQDLQMQIQKAASKNMAPNPPSHLEPSPNAEALPDAPQH